MCVCTSTFDDVILRSRQTVLVGICSKRFNKNRQSIKKHLLKKQPRLMFNWVMLRCPPANHPGVVCVHVAPKRPGTFFFKKTYICAIIHIQRIYVHKCDGARVDG